MIIDCHGQFTTVPYQLRVFRKEQVDASNEGQTDRFDESPAISDDELRESLEGAQLKLQRERRIDF